MYNVEIEIRGQSALKTYGSYSDEWIAGVTAAIVSQDNNVLIVDVVDQDTGVVMSTWVNGKCLDSDNLSIWQKIS